MKQVPDIVRRWEKRRAALSHDLLKNELMPSLSKLLNVCSGRVVDGEFEAEFLRTAGRQLQRLFAESRWLAGAAECALTPRQFFTLPPLCGLDGQTRRWLPALVHAEWAGRVRLRERTRELLAAIAAVEGKLSLLEADWSGGKEVRHARGAALREALQRLSGVLTGMGRMLPYCFEEALPPGDPARKPTLPSDANPKAPGP